MWSCPIPEGLATQIANAMTRATDTAAGEDVAVASATGSVKAEAISSSISTEELDGLEGRQDKFPVDTRSDAAPDDAGGGTGGGVVIGSPPSLPEKIQVTFRSVSASTVEITYTVKIKAKLEGAMGESTRRTLDASTVPLSAAFCVEVPT